VKDRQESFANPKKSLRDIAFVLSGRFQIARWAPIPLRLIVGFGFMEHGFAKLSKGPDALAAIPSRASCARATFSWRGSPY